MLERHPAIRIADPSIFGDPQPFTLPIVNLNLSFRPRNFCPRENRSLSSGPDDLKTWGPKNRNSAHILLFAKSTTSFRLGWQLPRPCQNISFLSVSAFSFFSKHKSRNAYLSKFSQVCIDLWQKRFADFLKGVQNSILIKNANLDTLKKMKIWTHLKKSRRTEFIWGFYPWTSQNVIKEWRKGDHQIKISFSQDFNHGQNICTLKFSFSVN